MNKISNNTRFDANDKVTTEVTQISSWKIVFSKSVFIVHLPLFCWFLSFHFLSPVFLFVFFFYDYVPLYLTVLNSTLLLKDVDKTQTEIMRHHTSISELKRSFMESLPEPRPSEWDKRLSINSPFRTVTINGQLQPAVSSANCGTFAPAGVLGLLIPEVHFKHPVRTKE